jgi:hypothetical protein
MILNLQVLVLKKEHGLWKKNIGDSRNLWRDLQQSKKLTVPLTSVFSSGISSFIFRLTVSTLAQCRLTGGF